jgi:beta-N-acetylhexosaminidase
MTVKAFICGLRGLEITPEERAFFEREKPWGYILFARNVDTPEQVTALCADLRSCVGRDDAPILMDQEGGRVQRLRPPHWYKYPAAEALATLYEMDREKGKRATWLLSRLHAFDLLKVGVTVDCLPVIDVPSPDGHDVIGDRAYGKTAAQVSALGKPACEGLFAGGVMPVIKHIPGHGRAAADSHLDLPVVDTDFETLAATDFQPFVDLNHIPMAMTAHVIYSVIDPDAPATTSKIVMDKIVRGHMAYDGLVMSDDITMGALSGDLSERTKAIFEAGCDIVLHCTGQMAEMEEVAAATPFLEGKMAKRADIALQGIGETDGMDEQACRDEFDSLMQHTMVSEAKADPTDYGKTA